MDDHRFHERFFVHVAPLEVDVARRSLLATLDALGEALDPNGAAAVAEDLPPALREPLLRGKGPQDLGAEDVYRHVARKLGVEEGRALELTQMVLEALAAIVEPETVGRLRRELGEPLAGLLVRQPPPPPPTRERLQDRTLAAGKPGSDESLSEANPGAGHSESVANAENPHGARKLSSARPDEAGSREDDTDNG